MLMHAVTQNALPKFVELGTGKIANLLSIFEAHSVACSKVLLLHDATTVRIGGQSILDMLNKKGIATFGHSIANSSDKDVNHVNRLLSKHQPDLVIGFGGGKVIDIAKISAAKNSIRFISIPTTLSNDGLASPVSVIKDANDIPISHITKPPYGVIIDVDIVKQAPLRHLMAGVGDLISNLSAVFDARLARQRHAEDVDENSLELAEAGGKKLLELQTRDINDPTFLSNLAQGLIKSGFSMCIYGTSRPASGSEHKISHSIDHYFPLSQGLHGEQVGIAAIFTMFLQKNKYLEKMKRLYKRIGFPAKLSYLGLSQEEFIQVVVNATKIRPERYTILEEIKPTAEDIQRALEQTQL